MKWHFLALLIGTIGSYFSIFYKSSQTVPKSQEQEPPAPQPAPKPVESPPAPAPISPKPTINMLDTFCHAIENFEGGPNDANHRNNNPGNVRFSEEGYLAKYGKVRRSPAGFAIFPTYELGWEYLKATVRQRARNHPNWTIYDFFGDPARGWAPKGDGNNDPKHYAEVVAARCGVFPTITMKQLFG